MRSNAPRRAEQPGQRVAHADVGAGETGADERGAEGGGLGRDPQVGGGGDAEAAAVRSTVDGGDDDLGQRPHVDGEVGHELLAADPGVHVRVFTGPRRRAEVLEVEAGAEPPTRAGQHHHPAAGVAADGVERVVQVCRQLEVERVQSLRTVERDLGDVGRHTLDGDGVHRQLPTRLRMTSSCSASRAPTRSVVTGLASQACEAFADARRRTDERDLVGELLGHRGDRLVALAFEEQILHAVRLFLVAHPRHQLGVVVLRPSHPSRRCRSRAPLRTPARAALTSSVTATVTSAAISKPSFAPTSWSAYTSGRYGE